jgi:hypothetical protein
MFSNVILVVLALVSLLFGGWAGVSAFADTAAPLSSLAMMGMMGYLFHAAVILLALTLPTDIRKKLTLLLLVWHVPEATLIAIFGMGVPDRAVGVAIHAGFATLALLSWYLVKDAHATATETATA